MKHTFTLIQAELKDGSQLVILVAPNGGNLFVFEKEMFPNIQTIRGASIQRVKQYIKEHLQESDTVEIIDKTNIEHEVCSECDSIDFDVKAWVNEKDGNISKPDEIEAEDCWCNKCQKHTKPEIKSGYYTLYNSEKETMKGKKFYRTVFQIEVLSEEKFDAKGDMSLTDIDEAITNGDCSGVVKTIVDNEVKTGEEMAKLLMAQGSAPEFFRLDYDGNSLDEEEEE